jgi:uncharacterized protein (DUF488 family)
MPDTLTLYTLGHSNHPIGGLVDRLRAHAIEALVDVRSQPHSRYVPEYNREPLRAAVEAAGLAYLWEGEALGGRPRDPGCYRAPAGDRAGEAGGRGEVDWDVVAQRPWFLEGLQRLLALARERRTAILCSEEDPRRCHRHHLVARALLPLGVTVLHLRKTGAIESAEALLRDERDRGAAPTQLELL